MLLTAPLLTKSTIFSSLVQKCRQVLNKKSQIPTTTTLNNTIKNSNNNNNFTPLQKTTTTKTNDDTTTVINIQKPTKIKSKTNAINASRPALLNGNIAPTAAAAVAVTNTNHISTTTTSFKSLEEKIGLPPRPKKPITPFFRFLRDMRPKIQADNPKLSTMEIVRELSKQWPMVDTKIKERLENEYRREQQAYVEERAKYDAKITPEQRTEMLKMKEDEKDKKERRQLRDRVRSLGRPKRPASAFLRFIKYERESTPQLPSQTFRDWHAKCCAKWARLTKAEKERFFTESNTEMETYKKKLLLWEEKMMKLGNVDLVRHSVQIDPPEPKPKKR